MRKLGIYLVITLGAILLAPFVIDQLFFFFFLGKIPFTNISLPAILMVIFWAIIVPSAIILSKSKKRTYFIINLSTFQYEKERAL